MRPSVVITAGTSNTYFTLSKRLTNVSGINCSRAWDARYWMHASVWLSSSNTHTLYVRCNNQSMKIHPFKTEAACYIINHIWMECMSWLQYRYSVILIRRTGHSILSPSRGVSVRCQGVWFDDDDQESELWYDAAEGFSNKHGRLSRRPPRHTSNQKPWNRERPKRSAGELSRWFENVGPVDGTGDFRQVWCPSTATQQRSLTELTPHRDSQLISIIQILNCLW